jgi:hypothetical protein
MVRLALACVALAMCAPVLAADLPKRKSGLWEVATSQPGAPAMPGAQLCIDEKTDDMAKQLAQGAMSCSRQDVRRESSGYVVESVCRIGESTATTLARITGDFQSAYQVDVHSRYDPPLMGMADGKATVKARWLGPCRPGQRAGDMTLPGGPTINIFDAPKGAPKR